MKIKVITCYIVNQTETESRVYVFICKIPIHSTAVPFKQT